MLLNFINEIDKAINYEVVNLMDDISGEVNDGVLFYTSDDKDVVDIKEFKDIMIEYLFNKINEINNL